MNDDFLKSLEGWESPYLGKLSLDSRTGDQVVPDDPQRGVLIVEDNTIVNIKALYHQVLKVKAISGESAYVRRTVARLEDDNELDIAEPIALDTDLVETGIDTSKCAACEMKIASPTDMQLYEGKAYHSYCLLEVDD